MYTHIVVDENWLMIGCCFSLSSATGTADVISQTHAELHGKHADVVDFRRVRLQALNSNPQKQKDQINWKFVSFMLFWGC